jgi:hypothetical protein
VTVEGQTVEAQAMNWVYILVKVLTPWVTERKSWSWIGTIILNVFSRAACGL